VVERVESISAGDSTTGRGDLGAFDDGREACCYTQARRGAPAGDQKAKGRDPGHALARPRATTAAMRPGSISRAAPAPSRTGFSNIRYRSRPSRTQDDASPGFVEIDLVGQRRLRCAEASTARHRDVTEVSTGWTLDPGRAQQSAGARVPSLENGYARSANGFIQFCKP